MWRARWVGQPRNAASITEIARAFGAEADEINLNAYAVEDWVTLAVFWVMALCVFLQFFTRYALNNSLAWTEEIATNCLIVVVFLGSVMCVRMSQHIRVDIIYRVLPQSIGRYLALAVTIGVGGFYAAACWLFWRYVGLVGHERMVTVDLPRRLMYYTVLAAFVLMLVRTVQVFWRDRKRAAPGLAPPPSNLEGR